MNNRLIVFWIVVCGFCAFAQVQEHQETGLVFPEKISKLKRVHFEVYDDEELGTVGGYSDGQRQLSFYVYRWGNLPKNASEKTRLKFLEGNYLEVKAAVEQTVALGRYEHVRLVLEQTFPPSNPGDMVAKAALYKVYQNGKENYSFCYVTIVDGFFAKVRFTYPSQNDLHILENFLEYQSLPMKVPLVDQKQAEREKLAKVANSINEFLAAPLQGRVQANEIIKFATESDAVIIEMDATVMTLLGATEDKFEEYRGFIFVAYIAGNVRDQLEKSLAVNNPYAGILTALEVYKKIKKQNPKYKVESLEKIDSWHKKGKLEEEIKKLLGKPGEK